MPMVHYVLLGFGVSYKTPMPWEAQQTMKDHHEVHEAHEVFSSVPSCPSW